MTEKVNRSQLRNNFDKSQKPDGIKFQTRGGKDMFWLDNGHTKQDRTQLLSSVAFLFYKMGIDPMLEIPPQQGIFAFAHLRVLSKQDFLRARIQISRKFQILYYSRRWLC